MSTCFWVIDLDRRAGAQPTVPTVRERYNQQAIVGSDDVLLVPLYVLTR
jgi:hypothetical protein